MEVLQAFQASLHLEGCQDSGLDFPHTLDGLAHHCRILDSRMDILDFMGCPCLFRTELRQECLAQYHLAFLARTLLLRIPALWEPRQRVLRTPTPSPR